MNLGVVIDTAIGLVFTYFLLSIIASGIQEVVAGIFSWRGIYLSKGIDVILDNDAKTTFRWTSVGDFLRAHFTTSLPETAAARHAAKPVPAIATAAQQEQHDTLGKVLSVQTHPLLRGTPSQLPSYVPARNFALALLETLRDGSQAPLFSQAERTISKLPPGDLQRTLSLFVQNAGGDLDIFRASLETWFDDSMDRLSGIYSRMSQYVMLILGILLALGLNVDSARLARTLWLNDDLRAAVVTDATTASNTPTTGLQQAWSSLASEHLPIGWAVSNQFRGWNTAFTCLGWLFTAGAVGLGAPFWFGLLQQLVNFRSSGPPPARAPPAL